MRIAQLGPRPELASITTTPRSASCLGKNRKALKYLNAKLETLGGALQEQDDDDMVRILNSRLTQEEYDKANAAAAAAAAHDQSASAPQHFGTSHFQRRAERILRPVSGQQLPEALRKNTR